MGAMAGAHQGLHSWTPWHCSQEPDSVSDVFTGCAKAEPWLWTWARRSHACCASEGLVAECEGHTGFVYFWQYMKQRLSDHKKAWLLNGWGDREKCVMGVRASGLGPLEGWEAVLSSRGGLQPSAGQWRSNLDDGRESSPQPPSSPQTGGKCPSCSFQVLQLSFGH